MPNATVGAIVVDDADSTRILLTRRNVPPFLGQWCIPGGHIDRYESARDAVVREVREETGLDFTPRFFGYFDELLPRQHFHAVVLVFVGTAQGRLRADPHEVREVRWFGLDEASELPLAFTHNAVLAAYARSLDTAPPPVRERARHHHGRG